MEKEIIQKEASIYYNDSGASITVFTNRNGKGSLGDYRYSISKEHIKGNGMGSGIRNWNKFLKVIKEVEKGKITVQDILSRVDCYFTG